MTEDGELRCDVLIIGAGLAGASLARQLRLQQPDLDIVVVDRADRFVPGLDEPTGEEFTDYANRVLKIGPYLRKHHIVGSGTRYFFDSAERDLPVERMSEIGGSRPHPVPTYLIDRPAVEQALCELNRADGVRVLLGVEVVEDGSGAAITLDAVAGHRVRTTAGVFRCRWLVDAAGPASPLSRVLDLVQPDDRAPVSVAWARFTGCVPLDELGTAEWRNRVPYWGRGSSTAYFMYRGYWIWLLPLSEREHGIGIAFDRRHATPSVGSAAELVRVLREHRAFRDVLGQEATVRDFRLRKDVARQARQQFSTQRWFLTGGSGTALDPMFGTASWLFTENNKLIGEFIRVDRAGEADRLPSYEHHYGIRVRSRYEKLLGSRDHYLTKGCFDAWAPWIALRSHVYYNRIVPDALEDHRVLLHFCRAHDVDCSCESDIMRGKLAGLLEAADRLTEEFVSAVGAAGRYHEGNADRFLDSSAFEQDEVLLSKIDQPRVWEREFALDRQAYADFCRTLARSLVELDGAEWDEDGFTSAFDPDWDSGQTLAQMSAGARA